MSKSRRIRVKMADECPLCPCCYEPFCTDCGEHYADCACVGPHSEGYTFHEIDGVLWAEPDDTQEIDPNQETDQ